MTRLVLATVAVLSLSLFGCSDDDDDRSAASTTTAATSSTTERTTTTGAVSTSTTEAPCEDPPPPPTDDGSGPARVLGRTVIAGSAPPVVFVHVGSGASVTLVGLFSLEGCTLTRVVGPDGGPSTFPIGGSVTHLDGLRCEDGVMTVLSATSTDGVSYAAREQRLAFRDGALTADGPPVDSTIEGDNPALAAFGSLSCPGVESP